MAVKKKPTFEQQLAGVEALIGEMEDGRLGLEESLARYEEGVKLLSSLEEQLANAQQRLTVLRRGDDGVEREEKLEVQDAE